MFNHNLCREQCNPEPPGVPPLFTKTKGNKSEPYGVRHSPEKADKIFIAVEVKDEVTSFVFCGEPRVNFIGDAWPN